MGGEGSSAPSLPWPTFRHTPHSMMATEYNTAHTGLPLLFLHGADLQIRNRLEDPLLQGYNVGANHLQAIKVEVLLLREELEACESTAITVVDHKHTHYDTPVLRAEFEEYKRKQAALREVRHNAGAGSGGDGSGDGSGDENGGEENLEDY